MSQNESYTQYDLKSIDAWENETDGYEWNDVYTVEEAIFISDRATLEDVKAVIIRTLFHEEEKAAAYTVLVYNGDIYELQNRETGRPMYALVPAC